MSSSTTKALPQNNSLDKETSLPYDDDDDDDDEAPPLVVLETPPTATTSTVVTTPPAQSTQPPCPLTIVTGFLGAGKTTLIQSILHSPHHHKKIAVIENEFRNETEAADLNIESLLLQNTNPNNNQNSNNQNQEDSKLVDLIELPNGCVCCTVKDTLVQTLEGLLKAQPQLDHILLECSGMAHPGPLLSSLWLDKALDSPLECRGIVTVVDVTRIRHQLDVTIEAGPQVVYANHILLNKCDLLSSSSSLPKTEDLNLLKQYLQQWNPLAELQETQLLNPSSSSSLNMDWTWLWNMPPLEATAGWQLSLPLHASITTSSSTRHHHHTQGVSTLNLITNQSLDRTCLERWLTELLAPPNNNNNNNNTHKVMVTRNEIWRLKGIVHLRVPHNEEEEETSNDSMRVTGMVQPFFVQAVYDTWQLELASSSLLFPEGKKEDATASSVQPESPRLCNENAAMTTPENAHPNYNSQLIVIGKHLEFDTLMEGLTHCCGTSSGTRTS